MISALSRHLPGDVPRLRLDDGHLLRGAAFGQRFSATYRGIGSGDWAHGWLGDSDLLQIDHPKVRLLALKLTQLKSGDREKALACYEFVHRLEFRCSMDARRMPSVEVLTARRGDSLSKSTLFIALLRSIGIPARLRVVLLRPSSFRGLSGLDHDLAEHAFTEMLIQGEWLAVDSSVVDLPLGFRARARLQLEGRKSGYGVHVKGQVSWDGHSSSFGQFSDEDQASLPLTDLGTFDDVQQFQLSRRPARLSAWAVRKRWQFVSIFANRQIRSTRAARY